MYRHVQDNALSHDSCSCRWNVQALALISPLSLVWATLCRNFYMLRFQTFLSSHQGTRHNIIFNKPTQMTTQTIARCRRAIFIRGSTTTQPRAVKLKRKETEKLSLSIWSCIWKLHNWSFFFLWLALDPTHCWTSLVRHFYERESV